MTILRNASPSLQYSNPELIAGIEQGNAQAASVFYRRFGKRVGALVWTLMGGDADHDDIVQNVFVNLIGSIGSVRDSSKLAPWVDSVVYRVVFKELRSRKRSKTVAVDPSDETFEKSGSQYNTSIIVARFFRILDQMEPADRMLFSLKYLDNLMLTDIAEVSNLSVSTVKRRLKNAKTDFEQLVKEDVVLQSCALGAGNLYRRCS